MSKEEKTAPSRVSITYSVDFTEVPDRVNILLTELANSCGGIAKLSRDAAKEVCEEPFSGTRKIIELKTLIEKMVLRSGDCVEIMMGYIRMLQEQADAARASEPPERVTKKKTTKKKTTKKKTTKKKEG
jgi:hypothetical protein